MELTPREKDKLLIFTAACWPNAQSAWVEIELTGGGGIYFRGDHGGRARRTRRLGLDEPTLLTRDDVMDRVAELIPEIQVQATFPDGTKLVTVHNPIV